MRWIAGILGVLILSGLMAGQHFRFGLAYLPEIEIDGMSFPGNPYVATAQTARHLWEKGHLNQTRYAEIRTFVREKSLREPGVTFRPDLYSVGRDGTLWPKHCVLMSLLATPFYGLLGYPGIWILNQMLLFSLLLAVYTLASELTAPKPAFFSCALLAVLTNLFWRYSFTLSYDVLGAACLLGGFVLVPRMPLLAGVLWAAALAVRSTQVLVLPALAWIALHHYRPALLPTSLRLGVGLALGLVPLLAYHSLVFGAPFKGAYAGIEYFRDGQSHSDLPTHSFSWRFFTEHWEARLFGMREGLWTCNPIWIFLLVLPFTGRHRHRTTLWSLLAMAVLFAAVMLCFSFWQLSGGDRFVLASTMLMALPAAVLFERFLKKEEPASGKTEPSSPGCPEGAQTHSSSLSALEKPS